MTDFKNPFRPGAGHTPPYLAGRLHERKEFLKLLDQSTILENLVITGLRGAGKTVLLESFKPEAIKNGWLWIGADLSESTSISEDNISIRICTDISVITSGITISKNSGHSSPGFIQNIKTNDYPLNYRMLRQFYDETPGLASDKLKAVIEFAWQAIKSAADIKGIIFAYDEAQNLSDQAAKEQYPLSLLLDTFVSLQKKEIPLMLVLTGLPTLFPKLVESRTYSERMFRVLFLNSLSDIESTRAILEPIDVSGCPVVLSENSVSTIINMSGGYPYFIQFICREVYDSFLQKLNNDQDAAVPVEEIEHKLDTDFFAGRWARATDRQRELLHLVATLDHCDDEFTVQEIVDLSKNNAIKPFGNSQVNQMLSALSNQGLVFKNRFGKYSFAVPLMGAFIKRQANNRDSFI